MEGAIYISKQIMHRITQHLFSQQKCHTCELVNLVFIIFFFLISLNHICSSNCESVKSNSTGRDDIWLPCPLPSNHRNYCTPILLLENTTMPKFSDFVLPPPPKKNKNPLSRDFIAPCDDLHCMLLLWGKRSRAATAAPGKADRHTSRHSSAPPPPDSMMLDTVILFSLREFIFIVVKIS